MTEEIILKKDVRKLGDRGQLVSVAAGYARNYLYPQNLAMRATAANKKQLEEMRAAASREADRLRGDASQVAESMGDITVRAVARAGETGVLFGSITSRDIASLVAEKGHNIDRHQVVLGSPLKEVGDYDVRIHLYKDVNVEVKVEVRAEGREDELFGEAKRKADEEAIAEAEALLAASEKAAAAAEAEQGEATTEQQADGETTDDTAAIEDAAEEEADKA